MMRPGPVLCASRRSTAWCAARGFLKLKLRGAICQPPAAPVSPASSVPDQPPDWIFTAICNDFETAWDALAGLRGADLKGGGNFMFARQAMVLLEWACRQCAVDQKGKALRDFGRALHAQRPAYFTRVPAPLNSTIDGEHGVRLPDFRSRPGRGPLLWLLWDVIRNGQAHQYQHIVARLGDGDVYVSLGGPSPGLTLDLTREHRARENDHLVRARPIRRRELGIVVRPEWLYLDLQSAVVQMGLLARGLPPPAPLTRPDVRSRYAYAGLTLRGLGRAVSTVRRRRHALNSDD
jgi:hypothetical protein